MLLHLPIVLSTLIAISILPARTVDAWDAFDRDAKRLCPSHHLEWLPDIWSDLPEEFERTLPRTLKHRITSQENFRRCAREAMGFYCEGLVSMTAYQRTGILERFTKYTCRRFVCTEGSICSDKEHP